MEGVVLSGDMFVIFFIYQYILISGAVQRKKLKTVSVLLRDRSVKFTAGKIDLYKVYDWRYFKGSVSYLKLNLIYCFAAGTEYFEF